MKGYVDGTYIGPRFQNERKILLHVTRGLAHLHKLGIVHRDIEPTNILIHVPKNDDQNPQMKLADFGLAKAINTDRVIEMIALIRSRQVQMEQEDGWPQRSTNQRDSILKFI